ncbi:MAG: AI-2E family transporter [Bacteroidales bacterium]
MNRYSKYIIAIVATLIIGAVAWYFSRVILYILLSAVLSLIATPLMGWISSIKVKRFQIPRSLAALLTIVVLLSIFLSIFLLIAPILGSFFSKVASLKIEEIETFISEPFYRINRIIAQLFPNQNSDFKIERLIFDELKRGFTTSSIASLFSSVANVLINTVMAIFIVLFITFFFIKEKNMFDNIVVTLFPDKFEPNVRRALASINTLLVRYFIGISVQIAAITLLNSIGLHFIAKLDPSFALVLALITGVLNIIPYVGPWIGAVLAILLTLITQAPFDLEVGALLFRMVAIFLGTQLIDNFIFQPFIFSNSVRAHPLEIFIVVLIATGIAGILGMLIAIPAYTVIRIFAREFFSHLKVVKKLTENIES